MLSGKTVVVGVCGGIADYKAVDVVNKLRKQNADVYVVMTKSACQFVTPLTFQATSKNMVMTSETDELSPLLLEVLQRADCFLIVPASSNIIGKVAYGICDSVLSIAIPKAKCPVVFVPNHSVYTNTIAKANVGTLLEKGYQIIEPGEDGASGGKGKIAHVDDILEYVMDLLVYEKDMDGINIMLASGSAKGNIDPLICITNYSAGKIGRAIARQAVHRGANVTVITARNMVAEMRGTNSILVNNTEELCQNAMKESKKQAIIIKSATIEDFRPAVTDKDRVEEETVAFLKSIAKKSKGQVVAGFCMAVENVEEQAKEKMEQEGLDFIVACDVSQDHTGRKNIVKVITKDGDVKELTGLDRDGQANGILDVAMVAYRAIKGGR